MRDYLAALLVLLSLYQTALAQITSYEPPTTTTTKKPIPELYSAAGGEVCYTLKCPVQHTSCLDVRGHAPDTKAVLYDGTQVLCDMETDGGGWLIIQKRYNGNEDFYRSWGNYKYGFGSLEGDFWLGLETIHQLTYKRCFELRIDMGWMGQDYWAKYSSFKILGEDENYWLQVGQYSGTAGDSLSPQNNSPFTTKNRDNDKSNINCAQRYKGGWWYVSCHRSNLNGVWYSSVYGEGMNWQTLTGYNDYVTYSAMKIRPCYQAESWA